MCLGNGCPRDFWVRVWVLVIVSGPFETQTLTPLSRRDNVFFLLDKKRGGMSKTLFLACFVNFDKLLRPNLPRDFDEILC